MTHSRSLDTLSLFLVQQAGSKVPGLQYLVVDADHTLFEYAGGWADIKNQKQMTLNVTMMGYSMTKTFTAAAILELVELGKLGLEDLVASYLPDFPYKEKITIRQLLNHTSGIPNPVPLRWVHLAEENGNFDEDMALAQVLRNHPTLLFQPGDRFFYSNIGYWLLGKAIERVTGQRYTEYVKAHVLNPLSASSSELDFVIPDPARHASGYLTRYSLMNLGKGFFTDRKFWGGYEGSWLRLKSHYLNGPAFGGLVGSARGFSRFLQDQLHPQSLLFNTDTKQLLESQQTNNAGRFIPMTPGWHIGETDEMRYFFKEGGGGGFHCEMRMYPSRGIASIVMTNSTDYNTTHFLNRADSVFFAASDW